tara:strand:- start:170 stop:388 length:219 start_codon:yes stop_codon:yes gene_type:complete
MELKTQETTIKGPTKDATFLTVKGMNKKDGCDYFRKGNLKEIKNSYVKLAFYDVDTDVMYRWSNLFKVWIVE